MTKASKRSVPSSSSLQAAISDAFAAITSIGDECRESYDNMPENLQGASYAEGLSNVADTIEGLSEPELPDWLTDDSYYTNWTEDRRASLSRAARLNNAVAALEGAVEAIDSMCGSIESEIDELSVSSSRKSDETKAKITDLETKLEESQQVRDELQSLIDEVQYIEFPSR